jgi:dynein heavy chain
VQIEQTLNYKFEPGEMITLPHLEMIDVFSHALELQKISDQASSEAALKLLLEKVIPFRFRYCVIPLCLLY